MSDPPHVDDLLLSQRASRSGTALCLGIINKQKPRINGICPIQGLLGRFRPSRCGERFTYSIYAPGWSASYTDELCQFDVMRGVAHVHAIGEQLRLGG
jgi:hypothetical protein